MEYIRGPKWSASTVNTIIGEDHLGIKYVAILVADYLQSGITSITPRARYWSFFTWVLHDFIQTQPSLSFNEFKKYLKRQEWYYILANIAEAQERGEDTSQVMGVTKGLEVWNSSNVGCDCHYDYLKPSLGGYNIYRNVMKIIGVTIQSDSDNGIELDRITPAGLRLAKSFETVIKDTRYYKEWRHREEPVPKDVLLEYGKIAALSKLNTNTSADLPILRDLFMPGNSSDNLEKLRYESLSYYLHIVKTCSRNNLDRGNWRYMMYDVYSVKGQDKQTIPQEFTTVAKGWEIYQGRQMFTYSLEAMWFYVLELLSRHSYTKAELISKVFANMKASAIDLQKKVVEILNLVPLKCQERDDFIKVMGTDGSNVIDNIWHPLLVMLDVYYRFHNREDFSEFQNELFVIGGKDHISLKVWDNKVSELMDSKVIDLIEYILHYFILEQHKKVALDKILTTGNETYHFMEDEGRLYYISGDKPAFNVFRVDQGMSILSDLGFVIRQGNTWLLCS